MKLQFLAKTFEHFSCAGINLAKGQMHEFEDSLGERLLRDYPSDFQKSDEAPKDPKPQSPKTRKPSLPKSNKAVKKCSTCK